MAGASEIRAGGAFVEIGGRDISLKGALDKSKKDLEKFASFAATASNRIATSLAVMGSRARSFAGAARSAFQMAGKAASIFFAPLKILGQGLIWVGRQALSLASSLASIAWTQFKRGVLAATATLAASLKVFADFQKQLAMVNTMLGGGAGQSGAMLDEFREGLKRMSVEFGESTATLAKGLYDILSASIPAEKALAVLATAARAAKAGLTDTGTAADVLTTILNAYNLSADKAGDVSDLLFTIVKRGKTTFAELASSIGLVATTAASGGISLEEMGATLAVMTRNGVRTENAITALQAIISAFLKPTDEAVKTARSLDLILRDLGVDTRKLKAQLKDMGIDAKILGFEMSSTTLKTEGLRGVLTRIASLPPDVVSKLFPNVRAVRGVLPALRNMLGFVEDFAMMSERAGATEEAYEKMTDTIAHGFNQLKQSVIGLLADIGEMFGPTFEEALDILAGWVEGARGWLEEYREDFRWYINDAWEGAKSIFKTTWEWIDDNVLSLIGEDFDTAFENVRAAAKTFWEGLKTIWDTGVATISKVVDIVKMFFEDPAHAGRMLADAFNEVWEIAAGAVDFARGTTLLDKLADFFGGLVGRLRETGFVDKIIDLIAGVFALNTKLWMAVLEWTLALGKAIADAVWAGIAGPIEEFLRDPFGAKGGIERALTEAREAAGPRQVSPLTGGVSPALLPTGGVGEVITRPGAGPTEAEAQSLREFHERSRAQPTEVTKSGITQNVTINARNPLGPDVTQGIDMNLTRLKNRGR